MNALNQTFEEVTRRWERDEGGERHIRRLSDTFFVSVLHRLTGFGYWEWETAIVRILTDDDPRKFARGKWDDRECLIVRGDHRETLADKNEAEIMAWYAEHSNEKNSMESCLDFLRDNTIDEHEKETQE